MTKKLFLGISLNDRQRQEIVRLQSYLGDDLRLVPAANLHITLAFFGQVSNKIQRKLEKRIAALHKPPFSVTLDQLSHWQKPRILCLSGASKDKGLLQIVQECQLLAADLHLHHSEHVFTAHITLARKAQHRPVLQIPLKPLLIQPDAIHLFESKSGPQGVEYPILASWPVH